MKVDISIEGKGGGINDELLVQNTNSEHNVSLTIRSETVVVSIDDLKLALKKIAVK